MVTKLNANVISLHDVKVRFTSEDVGRGRGVEKVHGMVVVLIKWEDERYSLLSTGEEGILLFKE